jgi:hypothetical protein
VKVQWADIPAAVQKTITDHAEGGKVEEIERETKTRDGKKIEIEVRKDGKLMEFEYD